MEEDDHTDDDKSTASSIMEQEIHNIPEDALFELEDDIMIEIDDYVHSNIEFYSKPEFQDNLILYVAETIYEAAIQSQLFDNTEANRFEIMMTVQDLAKRYFLEANIFPPRSYSAETKLEDLGAVKFDQEAAISQIEYLKSIPQPAQRTQEWYESRNNLITASNIYKALGTEAQCNSLIYEKCTATTTTTNRSNSNLLDDAPIMGARGWGQKYEPITAMIYEAMYPGNHLDTNFGCICHREYPFIGASPDGIVVCGPRIGHLVEIKNVVSRELTDIPIESHWIQCQVQMEVCNLPFCDYIQTSMKEIAFEEFVQEHVAEYKGVFILLQRNEEGYRPLDAAAAAATPSAPPSYKYVYMPFHLLDCDADLYEHVIQSWIHMQLQENAGYFIVNITYWKLEEMSCVVIPRNRGWFQAVLPKFRDLWSKVEHARIHGYEHLAPKRRVPSRPNQELIYSFRVSLEAEAENEQEQNNAI